MYPCNKCLKNTWNYKYNKGMIAATCVCCGNEVEFEAKKRRNPNKIHAVADYKIINGQRYLKNRGEFKKVKLKKTKKHLQIVFDNPTYKTL